MVPPHERKIKHKKKKVEFKGSTLDRAIDAVSSGEYPYFTQTQYEKWVDSKSKAKKAEGLEEELEKHKRDRLIKAEAIDEDGVKNQELYDRVMNLTSKSAVTSETAAAIREAGIRRTEMRKAAEKAEKKRIRDAKIADRNRQKAVAVQSRKEEDK